MMMKPSFPPSEYKTVQVREGLLANMYPQLMVKGSGFDRTLGGLEMEMRLRQHLAYRFEVSQLAQSVMPL